jgi:RHS repeat-associated protein
MELSESGEMVKWAIYHPFGREIVSVSASPVLPPLGSSIASGSHGSRYSFAGKEKDRESDVHYFEWRYYDDGSGRFTSVDPVYYEVWTSERGKEALLDPELTHPYIYARNGPMRYVDPTGQNPIAEACIDLASAVYHVWWACGSAILYGQWVLQGNDTYKQFGAEGVNGSINNAKNDVLAAAIPLYPSSATRFLGKSIVDEFQDALKKGNFKVGDGVRNTVKKTFTNKDYDKAAKDLGLERASGTNNSHWAPVYKDKKGNFYSPDVDGHNTTFGWKKWSVDKHGSFQRKETLDDKLNHVKK